MVKSFEVRQEGQAFIGKRGSRWAVSSLERRKILRMFLGWRLCPAELGLPHIRSVSKYLSQECEVHPGVKRPPTPGEMVFTKLAYSGSFFFLVLFVNRINQSAVHYILGRVGEICRVHEKLLKEFWQNY